MLSLQLSQGHAEPEVAGGVQEIVEVDLDLLVDDAPNCGHQIRHLPEGGALASQLSPGDLQCAEASSESNIGSKES